MLKGSKKGYVKKKSQILIKNFHPSIIAPISNSILRKFITDVMNGEDCKSFNIDVNLVENAVIRKINRKFLKHNNYTDIITFPYSTKKSGFIEGELFISMDEVKRNSLIFKDSFKNEFSRVIIHGCLHLAGFNDRTKKQKELIREKENFYLMKQRKNNVIRKSTRNNSAAAFGT